MATSSSEPSRRDTIIAVSLLVFGAVAVAFMPNTAKLAFNDGSNTETVVTIRALTAVVLLGGYMVIKGISFAIPASLMWFAIVACLSSALMNYCFYSALNYLDISLASLIIFTHPLWIAFYYHFTGKSPLTSFRLFWGVAALMGMTFALTVDFSRISLHGVALATGAAFFATTMVLSMIRVNERVGGITTSFHISFWAFLLFSMVLFSFGSVQWPTSTVGWVSTVGNGVAYLIAYLSFLIAAGLIGASRAAMLTFMEPITTILLAAWLFGERLSPSQWGGVALVAMGLIAMEAPKGTWSRLFSRKA
jgi:drug/metabolite transporter (DMT)-like permease